MNGKLIGTALGAGLGLAGGALHDSISKKRLKIQGKKANWWDRNSGKLLGTVVGGSAGYYVGNNWDGETVKNQKRLDKLTETDSNNYMSFVDTLKRGGNRVPIDKPYRPISDLSQELQDKASDIRNSKLTEMGSLKGLHGITKEDVKPIFSEFNNTMYKPRLDSNRLAGLRYDLTSLAKLPVIGLTSLAVNKAGLEYDKKMKKLKTKEQSNTGLILGSTLGALSGGLGGHILDKKIQAQGNFFNRNKAAIGGTVLGAFGGGIVGSRIDKSFNNSVDGSKSTFSDGIKSTQDGLNKGILNNSSTENSINSSFDKLNGGLRKDLVDSLKKSRKDYRLNLQNLALGTVATGVGAGITASAVKDSLNKRNKMQSYINENGDLVQYGTIMFANGSACKGWAVTKMHGMMDTLAKHAGNAANKWSKLSPTAKGAIIGGAGGAVVGGAKKGWKGALVGAGAGAAGGAAIGYGAGTKTGQKFINDVKGYKAAYGFKDK